LKPMAQSIQFHVETLWQGDKGTEPHQFEYRPARSLFVDGYGVWFTTTVKGDLWISNPLHHYLIRVNLRTNQTMGFHNPLAPTFHIVGGCPTVRQSGHLAVLMVAAKQPSQVVQLDRDAKVRSVFSLAEDIPFVPPIWFRLVPSRGSYLCSHRHFQLNGLVGESQLREYSMRTGECIQTIEGVTGVALGQDGTVYVSGKGSVGGGIVRVEPPRGLDSQRWLLIGVDSLGRLYWYGQEVERRRKVSRIACGDGCGRLLWEVPLTGSKGLLASVDPDLQIWLGWGCEWIEVSSAGHIEVFAWSDSDKERFGVGVYRVRWKSA
jgi:hypothetical protein